MRIVLLTTSYPRFRGDPSGHFVATEAERLAREGAHVRVLAGGDPPRQPDAGQRTDEKAPRIAVRWCGGGALFGWPGVLDNLRVAPWRALGAGAFFLGVRRELGREGPVDRVVAHWLVPCGWPLAPAGPELHAVAHGADVRVICALPAAARRMVLHALLERVALVRFVAESLRDRLCEAAGARLGARIRARSVVEPPPIDVDVDTCAARGAALRARLVGPGRPVVVTVGRLVADKRVALALGAVGELRDHAPAMVVVGDGPERGRLERRAARLGVDARFTGRSAREDALAVIGAADVLLHASSEEGAPTVIREARALGVPVVACDAGDVTRWAAADSGVHVCRPEARALADAIGHVLDRAARRDALGPRRTVG
jgi:glycosyltransferase involved in cell wall biosynthesis